MNSIDDQGDEPPWLIEAGEYVLGTLRGDERILFEKISARDPSARESIAFWEHHLETLDSLWLRDGPLPQAPENLWPAIEARLRELPTNSDTDSTAFASQPPARETSVADSSQQTVPISTTAELDKRANRFRVLNRPFMTGLAIAASALWAAFAMRIYTLNSFDDMQTISARYDVVSVLASPDGSQFWTIVADIETGYLEVLGINPPDPSESLSHQLWVVLPEDSGVQSIGLLPYGQGAHTRYRPGERTAHRASVRGRCFRGK